MYERICDAIFDQHTESLRQAAGGKKDLEPIGCEFWVQVRDVENAKANNKANAKANVNAAVGDDASGGGTMPKLGQSIGFHWDQDEFLHKYENEMTSKE